MVLEMTDPSDSGQLARQALLELRDLFDQTQGEIHPGWNEEYFSADWVRVMVKTLVEWIEEE